jgi:5-methylcytosine-specific restriction protein A
MVHRNPSESMSFMNAFRQYIQVMPIDRQTKDLIQPFLQKDPAERIRTSGKNSTSRSVSETKKKYVASQQGWKCKKCQQSLTAWFEVDHEIRLEHGGSNEVDNLAALCRNCHGEKTAMENI